MSKLHIIIFSIALAHFAVLGQNRRSIQAVRIENPPTIDGVIDEAFWSEIEPESGFYYYEPTNTGEEQKAYGTFVRMAYDNKALYFAAQLKDPRPGEVFRQFSQRDDIETLSDFFGIQLNTYDDGNNETRFFVTAGGALADARVSGTEEDFSYDVVFDGKVSFDEQGWNVEIKIPYNALRFPEKENQTWGINFWRVNTRENEVLSWNRVDRSVGLVNQQTGTVNNLNNIQPPLRLELYPYAQGLVEKNGNNSQSQMSAGMDLKYGISDSFTLDATLIPDFGQVAFDNVELNLSPFEQQFDENRSFFTEGTELFNKGQLFYSRRIGGAPSTSASSYAKANEIVVTEDSKTKLINAVKLSGRTQKNLGIGFFNAITQAAYGTLKDSITNKTREVLTEPVSNYNILVFDQQFNQNSSISLINTNVTRPGHEYRDGNVTALLFDLRNKKNSYNLDGGIRYSDISGPESKRGLRSQLILRKTTGNFRWGMAHFLSEQDFDINDMGIVARTNFNALFGILSYETFEPKGRFNKFRLEFTVRHLRRLVPNVFRAHDFRLESFFIQKNRVAFGVDLRFVTQNKDFYETRAEGDNRFVLIDPLFELTSFISTDYRKKLALDLRFQAGKWLNQNYGENRQNLSLTISPRFRFSNKFLINTSTTLGKQTDDLGYISGEKDNIVMGIRDVSLIENNLTASYNFDPFKSIKLNFRNFWSTAHYGDKAFYKLNSNGTRTPTTRNTEENNPNTNFNIWNVDLSFNWWFAPGSEMTLLYRNQLFNQDKLSDIGYGASLENLLALSMQHQLSLRVKYYIDANTIFRRHKG